LRQAQSRNWSKQPEASSGAPRCTPAGDAARRKRKTARIFFTRIYKIVFDFLEVDEDDVPNRPETEHFFIVPRSNLNLEMPMGY
jgi:hypothetical protein